MALTFVVIASSVVLYALERYPIETVSDELIHIALTGGGADNITVVVVDVL